MIRIVGILKNTVDAGCYEIEATPAPAPRAKPRDCACEGIETNRPPDEVYPRVPVDDNRAFVIQVDEADQEKWFKGAPPRFVFQVYLDGQPRPTARSIVWTPRRRKPLIVDLCTRDGPPPCGKVCGKITDCRGHPLAGLRVQIFDVDLYDIQGVGNATNGGNRNTDAAGKEREKRPSRFGVSLGSTVTNECGEYCVAYKYEDYASQDIDTADIRVVVGPPAGQTFRPLQVSDIQFNAPAGLNVDLVVPGSMLDTSSEFTDYSDALTKLGCATPDARADLSDPQLDFVSSEADIPLEHLVLLRQAYLIDREFFRFAGSLPAHVIPHILYGLLRMDVTGPFPSWARRYHGPSWDNIHVGDQLAQRLSRAIDRCIVSRHLGIPPGPAKVDATGMLIWVFSFFNALQQPLRPGRSSWRELLALIWLFPAQLDHLIQFGFAWMRFGVGDRMYQELASVWSASDINKLKTLIEYAEIAGFYAPAVQVFLADPVALAAGAASETAWSGYFTQARFAPAPLDTDFPSYAMEVFQLARARYGVRGVVGWVSGVNAGSFPGLGLTNAQATASAQRLSRLTTSAAFAARLAASGFTSARDIAALRWDDFISKLGAGASRLDALFSYTKAREIRAVSVASILQLHPLLNAPIDGIPVPFLRRPDLVGTTLGGISDDLFGGGSSCDCEGRQSVFSPAAYLHALRRFLANVSGVGGAPGGRAQLDIRRPDILKLKLSYVNTFTALPTIDLNIEVMEDLANQILINPALVPNPAARQTTLEAAELEIKPEYENQYPALYVSLAGASRIWPWRFPFDLNHARRRVYLDAIGLARGDILRLVTEDPPVYQLSEAALDLSDSQLAQLRSSPATAAAYNATLTALKSVPTMMERAQIDFQDLYALTRLTQIYSGTTPPAINPSVSPPAVSPSVWTPPLGACDPSAYTLNDASGSSAAMTVPQADRIHRFVRLWRGLPWPIHLLDWAIGSFSLEPDEEALPLSADETLPLKWLGAAELIRKRLKLKPHEVIAFWTDLSTVRWAMPFVKTKAIGSPWEQVFRVPAGDLTLPSAARAAGISEQFAMELAAGATTLTESIASRFFRYGRLSRGVSGLRPEDIKRYETLRAIGVFDSPDETWKAIEDFEAIRRSGARLSTALPLYLPQTDPTTTIQRRQLLAAVEELNRRTRIPPASFETALARFIPETSVSVVSGRLGEYAGATPQETADLDTGLAELLALPGLLTPPLSAETGTAARQDRILRALADQTWDRDIGGVLAQVSGLDPATARQLAEHITTTEGTSTVTIIEQLRRFEGDGGSWGGWPSGGAPAAAVQESFLESGSISIPVDAVTSQFDVTLVSEILVGAPGEYQVLIKATYAGGGSVQIGTQVLPSGELNVVDTFDVEEEGSATHALSLHLTADTACSIQLVLVALSGNSEPLPGTRFYSDSPSGQLILTGAMQALELLALAGGLATQWKLRPEDLAALIRIQSANTAFPQFPPRGAAAARPLETGTSDPDGFAAWLAYARLVAAVKLTHGEGRPTLYETAILAQAVAATAVTDDVSDLATAVWSGLAAALDLEARCVEEAAHQLFGVADRPALVAVANGQAWLKLFDLSRALQAQGVSADTLASWGRTAITSDAVGSLDAAARTRLAQSRSGAEKLREALDKIRVLKRDALADFLLASPPTGLAWQTRKHISDYLLTDIEMEPCAQTSRIRSGIAAAQRLITQTLAQAENLQLNAEQEQEWQSIFQYRLWEVREKILFYPENWLRFGQHLHKSPEFEELERSLLQGDLSADKAGEGLTRYVEQLHQIGHLEIVGTCAQQEYDVTGAVSVDRFHVIGRTPAEPRAYYHRERVDGAYWTPWVKIELDIDCDQIVPVIHNRQLHLFWLVEETIPQKKPDIRKDDRQLSLDDKYKILRLAWSVLTSKGWRAKMLSKGSLSTRFGHYAANPTTYQGHATPYAEVHAWAQAVQDIGAYQLRPTLSAEGDVVIEVFAPLTSTVVSQVEKFLADWVYEFRRTIERLVGAGAAGRFFSDVDGRANSALNNLVSGIRAGTGNALRFALPMLPSITPSGTRTLTSSQRYLVGTFRLTPDNLVEIVQRSSEFTGGTGYLTTAARARTLGGIGTAVPRSGAFEFDDGSVELYAGGAFRTVLGTAGTPVRVVVTRQEAVPSQIDPVFCRIKNRVFFASKEQQLLPQLSFTERKEVLSVSYVASGGYTGYVGSGASLGNQIAPREYVDRARDGAAPAFQLGTLMAAQFAAVSTNYQTTSTTSPWRFALAHHPQSIELLRAVRAGLDRLYQRATESNSRAATGSLTIPFNFDPDYDPIAPWVDISHLPVDELEFKPDQAYAVANWELLYHAPMAVAAQLMRVGRFDEARKWITHVFNPRDPAARDSSGGTDHPENYWVFKPFVDFVAGNGVGDFENLNPDGSGDPYLQKVFRALIKQWRANPYNPHAVAAFRPQAYQLAAIFLYVENLLAWGDSLFEAPSAELIEEAARRYEEAERVIGRPAVSTGAIRYDEYALAVADLDAGMALGSASLENGLSLGDGPSPAVEDAFLPDLAIGYFCMPPNPKISELRNRVQDRLFKVHHCLDLLGNPRAIPLFDPPIDPALLADAAMAGLNVSQAVMDAYTPRPHYRFRTLLATAKGLVQQVVSVGSGLLSAMEKRDAESLSLLKATHEAKVLERALAVRKLQVEDAQASIKALQATFNSVDFKRDFYATRDFMNAEETASIVLSLASTIFRTIGQALSAASSAAGAVPEITAGGAGAMGSPVALVTTGGANFSRVPAGLGMAMSAVGDFMGTFSSIAGTIGSYRRRKEDWDFQAKSAALELKQINAQILGAQIRQAIAERELENQEAQLEQSRDELEFVRTKQTAVRLYDWLAADMGASYYRAFQLAHSMSLQAQRALQDEMGSSQRFIGYAHWDGSHNGLQAGERLMAELLDMESQYQSKNARPVVKTMNVSLALVDPIALAELKLNGWCSFELKEDFWDRYAPGLYFRRFSSVSVSVPAVVGPFTGLHGRLTIERASYRKVPTLLPVGSGDDTDPYLPQQDDSRFVQQFSRPGDVILLSTGVRDTGLGGDEPKEDRYRPFENLGVDSSWRLDISQQDNAFDLSSIADVVLHVEYTARDGGQTLANAARASLATQSASEGMQVSLRHQFAGDWQQLKSGTAIDLNFAPQLTGSPSNGAGRKFSSLTVGILLRLKDQPEAVTTVSVLLNPPSAPLLAAGITQFGAFQFSFDPAVAQGSDGGARFGLDVKSLDFSAATDNLMFEALRSEPWTMSVTPVAGIELEDAVVSVIWSLGEPD
jgi:receptor-binding and translocation channel-forming TcA subunit of Tc toxin/ABC toxin-like protein/neuraminidase-like protein